MKKARLNKQVDKKEDSVENFTTKTKIITTLILLLTLGGFYYLTVKIVDKQKKETKEENKTINVREDNDINYSDIEGIKDSSYYVLLYKEDDEKNSQYDTYINSLKNSNHGMEYYYINLSKEENKDLLSDKEELKDLKKLKVKDTTLIFVEDGKIKENYVGSEKILNQLMSYFIKVAEDNNKDFDDVDESNSNSNKEKTEKSNSNKEEKKDK